jgi:hypothetical protein
MQNYTNKKHILITSTDHPKSTTKELDLNTTNKSKRLHIVVDNKK